MDTRVTIHHLSLNVKDSSHRRHLWVAFVHDKLRADIPCHIFWTTQRIATLHVMVMPSCVASSSQAHPAARSCLQEEPISVAQLRLVLRTMLSPQTHDIPMEGKNGDEHLLRLT
jgi:hypothetical protein